MSMFSNIFKPHEQSEDCFNKLFAELQEYITQLDTKKIRTVNATTGSRYLFVVNDDDTKYSLRFSDHLTGACTPSTYQVFKIQNDAAHVILAHMYKGCLIMDYKEALVFLKKFLKGEMKDDITECMSEVKHNIAATREVNILEKFNSIFTHLPILLEEATDVYNCLNDLDKTFIQWSASMKKNLIQIINEQKLTAEQTLDIVKNVPTYKIHKIYKKINHYSNSDVCAKFMNFYVKNLLAGTLTDDAINDFLNKHHIFIISDKNSNNCVLTNKLLKYDIHGLKLFHYLTLTYPDFYHYKKPIRKRLLERIHKEAWDIETLIAFITQHTLKDVDPFVQLGILNAWDVKKNKTNLENAAIFNSNIDDRLDQCNWKLIACYLNKYESWKNLSNESKEYLKENLFGNNNISLNDCLKFVENIENENTIKHNIQKTFNV